MTEKEKMQTITLEIPDTFNSIPKEAQKAVKQKGQEAVFAELQNQILIEDEKDPDEKAFNDAVRTTLKKPEVKKTLEEISDILAKKGF